MEMLSPTEIKYLEGSNLTVASLVGNTLKYGGFLGSVYEITKDKPDNVYAVLLGVVYVVGAMVAGAARDHNLAMKFATLEENLIQKLQNKDMHQENKG